MIRLLPFLIVLATVAAAAPGGDQSEHVMVGSTQRTYVLHLPDGAAPSKPAPLVLAFHGHGGTGAGQARMSGFDVLADRDGFVVAYPDGIDRGWNDGRSLAPNSADDVGFVNALIDELIHRYSIDPKRIYATGMSNGATFSQVLGCKLAGRIAAIAPVAGSMPVDAVEGCRPQRAISVLEIGGTADPIMPYDGGTISIFNGRVNRGAVLSVDKTVAFWAHSDDCPAAPVTASLPAIAPPDGTSIARTAYDGCRDGTAVVRYAVNDGGHTWPGGRPYLTRALIGTTSKQLDASQTIVDFFLAHPMR